ncbi:MAG: hypothetical protein V3571_12790 [Pseudodesulfovibrio sp.]
MRLAASAFLLLAFAVGCSSHSNVHDDARAHIFPCPSCPCGERIVTGDMELVYTIDRSPSGQYVFQGTATPQGVAPGTRVELALLSVDLLRDRTVGYSLSIPMLGNDASAPLIFRHEFVPDGGFDGVTVRWDVHYAD